MSSGQFNLRLICQTELGAEMEIMRLPAAAVDVVAGDRQDVRSAQSSSLVDDMFVWECKGLEKSTLSQKNKRRDIHF